MMQEEPQFLTVGNGARAREIAYLHEPARARGPAEAGVMWLSGFKSDMAGSKAVAVAEWAAERGVSCTRHDYSGHGRSAGDFEDACLSDWLEETLAVFDACCKGPTIIIGSSMGGWLAMLLTLARRETGLIKGLVLIAPAADFTEELMWKHRFSDDIRQTIMETGRFEQPSAYSEDPYVITRKLIEDGRKHLILDRQLKTGCPVAILQGVQDPDVPWQHAQRLAEALPLDDVSLTLIPDGDHRLSRPQDIELLLKTVEGLI
ncbi:alpha/beta hydrolase [Roseibium sediminis]|uniref:alpha/beta hydrolase n=1 Tax=Roseibium sediminis TaxID=1775174 RepID=UPI00123DBE5A|nr:alpha/beta hydrolase [Roseibium sediminis]